jgi:hypothetical protein
MLNSIYREMFKSIIMLNSSQSGIHVFMQVVVIQK